MNSWYQSLGLPVAPVELLMAIGLTLGRSVPTLFFNPFLGGKKVPAQVKMGVAVSFVVILLPSLMKIPPGALAGGPIFFFLMIKEIVIGVTLGFITSVVFLGFGAAGRLVDMQRGANMAEGMVYQLSERASVFGVFYVQTAIVVFLILNGHHIFLRGYFHSFEVLPVWKFPAFTGPGEPIVKDLMRLTADLFVIALQLGAPAFIALFITDVGFGIINRASPQINVFNLSQPVKMFLGVLMVLLSLRIVIDQFEVWMGSMMELVFRVVGYLAR